MPGEWRERVLLTLREKEWRDGKGFGLWVVQKIKDNASFSVDVRAGMYRPDKVTGAKILPQYGLNLADLQTLKARWTEVLPLLQIGKGSPVPLEEMETPKEDGPEEMPW